jgi:hypothetical protein
LKKKKKKKAEKNLEHSLLENTAPGFVEWDRRVELEHTD